MLNEFSRQVLLMGKENLSRLKNSHVAVFGVGGVGSYTAWWITILSISLTSTVSL